MILKLLAGLRDPRGRMEAARCLAEYLGFSHLIILLLDPEIGIVLPAPGFSQTFCDGEAWAAFISECREKEQCTGMLPYPDAATIVPATGIAGPAGSVAVFTGGNSFQNTGPILDILPFIVDFLTQEQQLEATRIRAALADSAAEKASRLAAMIDRMRLNLKEALINEERAKHDIEELMVKKDEFMNVASHELKTPITSMAAYLQILKKKIPADGNNSNGDLILKANKQIERLISLTSDLLDVTKIQAGQMVYHLEKTDIADVINEVASQMQSAVSSHRIVIQNNPRVFVHADRSRLEQVINNFLSNAIKYSPGADTVLIDSCIDGSRLRVSVKDFGIGVPTDKQPYLFDRFYRVHDPTYQFTGLGLGLFISSDVIRRHGGTVGMRSDGHGSEFFFDIPATNP